jgi:hypothetical protein
MIVHSDFPETALPTSEEESTHLKTLGAVELRDALVSQFSANEKTRKVLHLWGLLPR